MLSIRAIVRPWYCHSHIISIISNYLLITISATIYVKNSNRLSQKSLRDRVRVSGIYSWELRKTLLPPPGNWIIQTEIVMSLISLNTRLRGENAFNVSRLWDWNAIRGSVKLYFQFCRQINCNYIAFSWNDLLLE